MDRVPVQPELLRWAASRAGLGAAELSRRFPKLTDWLDGTRSPTFKQLESYANTTHTPIGYFFLPQPPREELPIADFRTVGGSGVDQPSADLLDTIYLCQQRQEWYRSFARLEGHDPIAFVGSFQLGDDVSAAATEMRATLRFDVEERRRLPSWQEALRRFSEQAEAAGILVMKSGVVGSNNRRKLDPQEFRGFALSDPLAPLVFVNGADTQAAQTFTLAHELVHIWLGQSALSDARLLATSEHKVERWCNQVAAELLVPLKVLQADFQPGVELWGETQRLARQFKVSSLVILRRLHDAGFLDWAAYRAAYETELARILALPKSEGGNYYPTVGIRVSKRFARAILTDTWEGRSSFAEAMRLLGVKKMSTFRELGRRLEVPS